VNLCAPLQSDSLWKFGKAFFTLLHLWFCIRIPITMVTSYHCLYIEETEMREGSISTYSTAIWIHDIMFGTKEELGRGALGEQGLGKMGHQAKWDNKTLPPAANKQTFHQMQNWSSGLASSWAKEQTKKHRPLIFHPSWGSLPEPIDMPFGILSGVPDIITHDKFYVNRLRGFSAAAPLKVPFSTLIWTTLTTVPHHRADCDMSTC